MEYTYEDNIVVYVIKFGVLINFSGRDLIFFLSQCGLSRDITW